MEIELRPSERIDDLLTHQLKIIQSHEVFCFSMDAVLLARFVSLPAQRGRIMDLCTGNGAIPLLMSTRSKAHIDGVEIQERIYDMATRNMLINQLTEQISIYHGDLKDAPKRFGHGVYDVVTCNPPYMIGDTGDQNMNEHIAIARHEIHCTLEDVIAASASLVKFGGKVAIVHRPARFTELVDMMRKYRIEPKRVRFVHSRAKANSNMVLVEGIRNGKPELTVLPPLIVYDENGEYCKELIEIYYGNRLEL